MNITEIVKLRRSVRTFAEEKTLDENIINEIKDFLNTVSNPYGIKIEWFILDKKENKLSSPVIVGEKYYIAGKMKKIEHAEEAFGYEFEDIVLFLTSKNIGTTWIAGTMNRDKFHEAVALKEDEVMPCVSPIGYPAAKMSIRESLMRKGVGADKRLDFDDLFFLENFDTPLTSELKEKYKDIFELVRLAPSAVNRQPWRLVIKDDYIHLYESRNKGFIKDSWDIQKIDMGIALNHLTNGLKERGVK